MPSLQVRAELETSCEVWFLFGSPMLTPLNMELGEGGDPWNSIYGSISSVRGRLDNWNWGPHPPFPSGRGDVLRKRTRRAVRRPRKTKARAERIGGKAPFFFSVGSSQAFAPPPGAQRKSRGPQAACSETGPEDWPHDFTMIKVPP